MSALSPNWNSPPERTREARASKQHPEGAREQPRRQTSWRWGRGVQPRAELLCGQLQVPWISLQSGRAVGALIGQDVAPIGARLSPLSGAVKPRRNRLGCARTSPGPRKRAGRRGLPPHSRQSSFARPATPLLRSEGCNQYMELKSKLLELCK